MAAAHAPKPPAMHPYRETESRSSREAKPRQTPGPQRDPRNTQTAEKLHTPRPLDSHAKAPHHMCIPTTYPPYISTFTPAEKAAQSRPISKQSPTISQSRPRHSPQEIEDSSEEAVPLQTSSGSSNPHTPAPSATGGRGRGRLGPGGEGREVGPALRRPRAGTHFLVLLRR